jgi:pimeloyl-ACP methyl ester carboxylesterase
LLPKLTAKFSTKSLTSIVSAACIGVLLAGCAAVSQKPANGGPQPVADSKISTELLPFYEQQLNWSSCGAEKTFCSSLEVPADWKNPTGDRFKLALVYRQADSATPIGSILFNPGGPGSSGVTWVKDSGDQIGTSELRKNFNIVGFDPRGVGASEPKVKCLTAKENDEMFYGASGAAVGSAADVADTRVKMKKFVDACMENTGSDLQYIDTFSAAKDMDIIRAVFGDSKMNYLGFSYGTYLGTVYANLFPERVGRMVLDGAIDPTVDEETQDLSQLMGFDQALRDFLADCLDNQDCPFTGSLAAAEKKVEDLLLSIEQKPLNTDTDRELTVWGALTGIIMPLYSQDWWPSLAEGFADALKGDGTILLSLADVYNDRSEDGTYLSNTIESNIAISCLDSRSSSDAKSMAQSNKRMLAASSMLGRYWQFGALSCEQWPYPVVKKPASFSASGSSPILVVGTTGDPATPYWQAVSLANRVLENAQLVTFNGEGHTAYGLQSSCINRAVDDFFIKNVVPTEDPDCG